MRQRQRRPVDPITGLRVIQRGKHLLVSQLRSYLTGCPVPVVGRVDLDDLLLIVRAGRAVRTATAKGDALAGGGSWRVAGGGVVKDETAFHGCGGGPAERGAGEARGRGMKGIRRRGGTSGLTV